MATFVEELVDDLAAQGIVAGKGVDAFMNELPDTDDSPETVTALQEIGGEPLVGTPTPSIDVACTVRSATDWETARLLAAAIYTRYHEAVNLNLASYRILTSRAVSLPAYIGSDSRGRHLVAWTTAFKTVSAGALEIAGFSFYEIGRTAAKVQYTANRDCACTIYTRKETPLGSWEGNGYPSYHSAHLHDTLALLPGLWYHLYAYAIDVNGLEDTHPTYPPHYVRFKTATEAELGIEDPAIY